MVNQLERAVRAEGSVETWLTSLLNTSQQSIHSIIRNAFTMMSDPNFSILPFLEKMPAQVSFDSIILNFKLILLLFPLRKNLDLGKLILCQRERILCSSGAMSLVVRVSLCIIQLLS